MGQLCVLEHRSWHVVTSFAECSIVLETFMIESFLKCFQKPFKCSHEGCGAAYAWNQHLKRHVEKVHGNTDMDKQFQ